MKNLLFLLFLFFINSNIYSQINQIDTLFKIGSWIRDFLFINKKEIYTSGRIIARFNYDNRKIDTIYIADATYFKKTRPFMIGSLIFNEYFIYQNNRWWLIEGRRMKRWFKNYYIDDSNIIYSYTNNNFQVFKNIDSIIHIVRFWILDTNKVFFVGIDFSRKEGLFFLRNDSLFYIFNKPIGNYELGYFFIFDKIYVVWPSFLDNTTIIYESNIDTSRFDNETSFIFTKKFVIGYNDYIDWFNYFIDFEENNVYLFGIKRLYIFKNNEKKVDSLNFVKYVSAMEKIGKDSFLVGNINGEVFLWKKNPASVINDKNNLIFNLYQNYPNPFNLTTRIKFTISEITRVELKVYNILGQEITTLVDKILPAGDHDYEFDGTKLTSGIYIYKIRAGNFIKSKKMILVK